MFHMQSTQQSSDMTWFVQLKCLVVGTVLANAHDDFASPSLFMALLYTADVILLAIINLQMVSSTLWSLIIITYSTFTIWCTSLAGRTDLGMALCSAHSELWLWGTACHDLHIVCVCILYVIQIKVQLISLVDPACWPAMKLACRFTFVEVW